MERLGSMNPSFVSRMSSMYGETLAVRRIPSVASEQGGNQLTTRQFFLVVLAVMVGTSLEWYDFMIFSSLSTTLVQLFFPQDNPVATWMSYWGMFAAGFVFRPLGSVVFGWMGDTAGRRVALMVSLLFMAVPTGLIGAMPTYQGAGLAAPIAVTVFRMLQGVALGGEFGTSSVYLVEIANKGRKAVIGAVSSLAVVVGLVSGTCVSMLVTAACTPDQLLAWGWRVSFLVVWPTAAIVLVLRAIMPEPVEFLEAREERRRRLEDACRAAAGQAAEAGGVSGEAKVPLKARLLQRPLFYLFYRCWRELLLHAFAIAWAATTFYVMSSWLVAMLQKDYGAPRHLVLSSLLVNYTVVALVLMAVAWAADWYRLPRLRLIGGALVIGIVSIFPVFLGFHTQHMAAWWLLQLFYLCMVAVHWGLLPATFAPIYPAEVRSTGYNLAHNAGSSWLGGVAPLIVTGMSARPGLAGFAVPLWIAVVGVVSMLAVAVMYRVAPCANRDPEEGGTVAAGGLGTTACEHKWRTLVCSAGGSCPGAALHGEVGPVMKLAPAGQQGD